MKEQKVHFKIKGNSWWQADWVVACDGSDFWSTGSCSLEATTRRSKVTCKRCQRTRVFRKLEER